MYKNFEELKPSSKKYLPESGFETNIRKAVRASRQAESEACGWVLTVADFGRDSEEGKKALEFVLNPGEVYNYIYDEIVNFLGQREVRFLGKAYLKALALRRTAELLQDAMFNINVTESEADKAYDDYKDLVKMFEMVYEEK